MIAGAAATGVDTAEGPRDETGKFWYRAAARKGEWKVEAVMLDSDGEPWHVGFVSHHVDVDGADVVRRAAQAGLGDGKGVVFVNRYEWSGSSSPGCESIVEAVDGKVVDADQEAFDDEEYYRSLVHSRFMLVDAQGFPALLQALKDGTRLECGNYVFLKDADQGFGVHVVAGGSGYDMGWMVFEEGELVGFVYDGAYSALDGDVVAPQ